MFRLGKDARRQGRPASSVYELPPGQAICPYHYEYGEEEWLLVLEGRPTLRTPEGERAARALGRRLLPARPRGRPPGPQRHRRDGARADVLRRRHRPRATVYPDSDKIGIWTGNKADDVMVRRASGVDYFDGETGAAD